MVQPVVNGGDVERNQWKSRCESLLIELVVAVLMRSWEAVLILRSAAAVGQKCWKWNDALCLPRS